jgi:hypothetical protein
MYTNLLKQISSEMSRQALQPPCSAHDLRLLKERSIDKLRYDIPDGYAHFLAITNGFVWNGLSIYASETTPLNGLPGASVQGFVEANMEHRAIRRGDPMQEYLVFGEDSVVFFTYHIPADVYKVIAIVGMSVHESYRTFDELLVDALQGHV